MFSMIQQIWSALINWFYRSQSSGHMPCHSSYGMVWYESTSMLNRMTWTIWIGTIRITPPTSLKWNFVNVDNERLRLPIDVILKQNYVVQWTVYTVQIIPFYSTCIHLNWVFIYCYSTAHRTVCDIFIDVDRIVWFYWHLHFINLFSLKFEVMMSFWYFEESMQTISCLNAMIHLLLIKLSSFS